MAFTRDQMPRAGRLHGAFYAGGYCGHGIAMATYLGTLVARRMAGEQLDHPLFDDHFRAIPFYNGTPWFLPIAGAYYTLMDWLQLKCIDSPRIDARVFLAGLRRSFTVETESRFQ